LTARAAFALAVLLAATPLVAAAAPPASPPPPQTQPQTQPTEGLPYVALGDSYAAGFGQTPTTGEPVKGCGQAANDYPHRIAATLGLQLTDVTCGGANTANILTTPQKVGGTPAPVQSLALGPDTQVVTITIGGNDLNFAGTLQSCVAATPHGPILETKLLTCKASYVVNGVDSLAKKISTVVSAHLAQTFATIRAEAPNAHVFVVGYPAIMPNATNTPAAGCFIAPFSGTLSSLTVTNAFPYTNTDVGYLHSVELALDNATRAAAVQAGFTFTSLLAGTEAHTPCGAKPWLNGITFHMQNTSSFTLDPGSLHPNSRGEAYAASVVAAVIRNAFGPTTEPTAAPTPTSTPGPTPSSTPTRTPAPTHTSQPRPSNAPSLVSWDLSLGLVIAVLLGAAVTVIFERRHSRQR
jgi:lysophospholipase L1-like esterase